MKKLIFLLSALILSSVAPLFASYCIHCGNKLPNLANFCSNCGQAVYKENENINSNNYTTAYSNKNNLTTTKTKVVYNDGVTTTSTTKTLSTYIPNENTQIVYKNEYYYPVPVTQTVVAREGEYDPLLGLIIWGIIHHDHHHHRHFPPAPRRRLPPPPPPRFSHSGVRRVHHLH